MATQPTYTRTNLKAMLSSRTGGKNDQLTDVDELLNQAVRHVLGDVDFRGAKRRSTLAPNLFDDIYSYTLPSDVYANKIIDIVPQVKRTFKPDWSLVPADYFERWKESRQNLVAIADDDHDRRLLVSRLVDDKSLSIAQFESLSGDGDTWSGFAFIAAGDTDNQAVTDSDIKKDADDFVRGNASIRFSDNGDTTATQAGLENRGVGPFDLEDYIGQGSIFVRGRLSTGDTNITQLNVRIGSDSSNFYALSDSTTNENFAFQTGWNTVRLDFSGKSTTGTPSDTAIDYVAVFWTKTANTHLTDTDYAFDYMTVNRGQIHDIVYYTRFLWQNSSGAYLENSSADTDRINLFNDEVEIVILKAWELASIELKNYDDIAIANQMYQTKRNGYQIMNPSEAMVLTQPVYEFESAPVNEKFNVDDTTST